jgi:hemerythrin-like domain-containing protein
MDIIELLKRQHEEVRDLLERMIAGDDPRESRALLGQVSTALRLHMVIEEKLVYPAAARAFAGDEDDEETVLEAYEEHSVARQCLETLEATAPNDKRFVVRAKIVKEILEKHIEEEENELLPELENRLGRDGIQRLGELIERRISELETEATRGRSAPRRKRSTERPSRARTGRSARTTRADRSAASSARGRGGAKARRSTQKTGTRSGGGSRSGSSRESNGNKPRRGESSSRSRS